MNHPAEASAPVPAHIPMHLVRDFDLWAELTAQGEHAIVNMRRTITCDVQIGDVLPLDDNGYIASTGFNVPAGQKSLARRGARACPERVIEIRDTPAEPR